jgi:hypothetical protein
MGVGTAQDFALQQSLESYICPVLSPAGYFVHAVSPDRAFADHVVFNLGKNYVRSHGLGTPISFLGQP